MSNGVESKIEEFKATGEWMTVGEIADILGVNRGGSIYEDLRQAKIPELKFGGHSLFLKASAMKFVDRRVYERTQREGVMLPVVGGQNNAGKLSHRIKILEEETTHLRACCERLTRQISAISDAFGGWKEFDVRLP